MKYIVCIFINMIVISNHCNAQNKLGSTWIVGDFGYQINFNTTPPTHDTIMYNTIFFRGHSCISDSNGQLLLMSDGLNVYDKTGTYIDGGDSLGSPAYYNFMHGYNDYAQGSILLPMDSSIYYLVTPSCNDTNLTNVWQNGGSNKGPDNLLLYNVIDMKANAGAGKVIRRMVPALENKELSKTQMMACKHGNGKDWWVLKKAGDSNNVYSFLFTQDSVYYKGIQRFNFPFKGYSDVFGQLKFNTQGTQMATTCTQSADLFVADFDRCTGLISNQKIFISPTIPIGDDVNAGLAYSPNGRFLYISKLASVFQLDLQDNNMATAWYQVCGMDTDINYFCSYTSLELAPDNKIYFGHQDGTCKQMSTIDNPDIKGNGCNFCRKCLRSTSMNGVLGSPPNMPNYNLSGNGCWPLQNENVKENENDWSVYPNPANTKFRIECKNPNSKKELYNSVGQLIFSTYNNEVDVSRYSKGVYYLKCGRYIRKLVVE